MILFNFIVDNPFSDRWSTIFFKNGIFGQHKAWEFNAYQTHHLIDLEFRLTTKGDHAGLQTMVGLFGYSIELGVYDTRHWDYENNRWQIYEEDLL